MLSFLFSIIFLMMCSSEWYFIIVSFGIVMFLFMVSFMNLGYYNMISYYVGIDVLSYGLLVLTLWIGLLMFLASSKVYNFMLSKVMFSMMVMFLVFFLFFCFCSIDILLFYIMFESSLMPIMLLVLGWGYQPERLQAGIYLIMYTLFASFPLFVGIMYMYMYDGVCLFTDISVLVNLNLLMLFWYYSLVFSFLVKMPMYMVHLWLPSAHVEAPISGSMILAGVLLKLGGYGLIRFMVFLKGFVFISCFLMSLSLFGGFLISINCLRQGDMKSLIAYSSVVHMSLIIGGIMSGLAFGLNGSIVLMIGHGLCSSGLFCLANMVYERLNSRSLLLVGGMLSMFPGFSFWWFLILMGNISAPPSLGLFGEIWLMFSMVSWSYWIMVLLVLISFMTSCYSIFLYMSVNHGSFLNSYYIKGNIGIDEFIVLFLHFLPLNLCFLKVDLFGVYI